MSGDDEWRVVVCGSRDYGDRLGLRTALNMILDLLPAHVTLVVVVGGDENPDYSTNADRFAQEWADEAAADGLLVRREDHPADWEGPCRTNGPGGLPGCEPGHRVNRRGVSLCPAAGPYRNEEMCALGADEGLAALRVGSKSSGSRDCLRAMFRHGIPFSIIPEGAARGLPQDLIESAKASGSPGRAMGLPGLSR